MQIYSSALQIKLAGETLLEVSGTDKASEDGHTIGVRPQR